MHNPVAAEKIHELVSTMYNKEEERNEVKATHKT